MATDDDRTPLVSPSVNSRLQVLGGHIYGGKFDAFLIFFCILGVFLWGEFGILGESPQEIAGNNTVYLLRMVVREPAQYKNV